jgi:hypothetical protein
MARNVLGGDALQPRAYRRLLGERSRRWLVAGCRPATRDVNGGAVDKGYEYGLAVNAEPNCLALGIEWPSALLPQISLPTAKAWPSALPIP